MGKPFGDKEPAYDSSIIVADSLYILITLYGAPGKRQPKARIVPIDWCHFGSGSFCGIPAAELPPIWQCQNGNLDLSAYVWADFKSFGDKW